MTTDDTRPDGAHPTPGPDDHPHVTYPDATYPDATRPDLPFEPEPGTTPVTSYLAAPPAA